MAADNLATQDARASPAAKVLMYFSRNITVSDGLNLKDIGFQRVNKCVLRIGS